MGFHTPKYTHVHTLGHTLMLKINMSESYVWSQTNKHTHPHLHTLWYKRICHAPTLYTCKTNGVQYPHSNITVTHSFPKDVALHTCQNGNTDTRAAVSSVQICHYMSLQRQCSISAAMVIVTCYSSGGVKGVLDCTCIFWVRNTCCLKGLKCGSDKCVACFFAGEDSCSKIEFTAVTVDPNGESWLKRICQNVHRNFSNYSSTIIHFSTVDLYVQFVLNTHCFTNTWLNTTLAELQSDSTGRWWCYIKVV